MVASAKKTFFAGGNLKNMVQATKDDAGSVFALGEAVKAGLRRLELYPRPVVAAINGAALGGGFEICLATNHRIAVDDDSVKLGLPESTLGLLPGGGGVTRVVRLLGLQSGLMDVLLPGTQFKPSAAKEKGLVDELVATREELVPAAKAWIKANPDETQNPWDRPATRCPAARRRPRRWPAFLPAFPALLRKQTKGAVYLAPRAILSAAVEGALVDFDTASRIESRYLTNLIVNQGSKNMIQAFFFDLQAINAGKLRPQGIEPWKRHEGRRPRRRHDGRRHRLLLCPRRHAGRPQGRRARERREGQGLLREAQRQGGLARRADRGEVPGAARPDHPDRGPGRPGRLRPGDRGGLRGPVAQAEGVRRDRAVRQRRRAALLQHLDAPDQRARHGRGPAGRLHRAALLQPVDKMPLVEIIKGAETSDVALAKAYDVVQQIRKTPIVVNDSRGFYTSRVIGTQVMEGLAMLAEGVHAGARSSGPRPRPATRSGRCSSATS